MSARPGGPPRATIRGPRAGHPTGGGPPVLIEERTLDEELAEQVTANRALVQRVWITLGGVGAGLAVLVLVLVVLVTPFAAVLLLGIGAAGFVARQQLTGADAQAIALSGARPADEVEHARLHNITDGLCASTGIARPALFVVDDAAPDAFAVGCDPRRPSLVVTRGLLEQLAPIELEGIVAQQLAHVRVHDIVPASMAVRYAPLRARLADFREWTADRAAVATTRYPPGLIGALEKVHSGAPAAGARPAALAHLWTGSAAIGSVDLEVRIDALREL